MPRKRKGNDVHGWLILDKPAGMTSNQALGATKRLYTPKKAGHAGTLDPIATGVLPIAFGEATKTVPYAMEGTKSYRFTIRWGASTDTLDREGATVATSDVRPSVADVEAVLDRFIGDIEQVPPAYSAIKVDGARAYDLARAGESVELDARTIRVDALSVLSAPEPDLMVLEMTCGKGAYVRAIVRDVAEAVGACGHVAALRRTRVGPFAEERASGLEALEEIVHKDGSAAGLLPVEAPLDDIPAVALTAEEVSRLRQGRAIVLLPHQVEDVRAGFRPRTIAGEDASRITLAMGPQGAAALGEVRAGKFQPTRVFQM